MQGCLLATSVLKVGMTLAGQLGNELWWGQLLVDVLLHLGAREVHGIMWQVTALCAITEQLGGLLVDCRLAVTMVTSIDQLVSQDMTG